MRFGGRDDAHLQVFVLGHQLPVGRSEEETRRPRATCSRSGRVAPDVRDGRTDDRTRAPQW